MNRAKERHKQLLTTKLQSFFEGRLFNTENLIVVANPKRKPQSTLIERKFYQPYLPFGQKTQLKISNPNIKSLTTLLPRFNEGVISTTLGFSIIPTAKCGIPTILPPVEQKYTLPFKLCKTYQKIAIVNLPKEQKVKINY
ncbi:hypothetical protein TTHERM_000630369 (macronuclear) [Tetrahymena thermophila SB210]|uniref:Uncharacterized protein n=1 Tax=Tetrahymena thermophila (strain SB210) TaxID=312017 RepID=W7X0C4_TETTS|nr:hypothetical protein TTHERM_000630369 [Tetrahymena thermophila SB210]EWS72565.1 hypothetical protein TTHERM_000630369 [Tetrahymena thermophila SB210]|eukprot:XP_012654848.1 hypothetical protein TTHERM_000630369 [Tetrahymena thermophila SB210]